MTLRIGMWSGPRNISTAMMRSWENRSDTSVVDEPFYAYYLRQTKSPHPMFDEILKAQDVVYENVAHYLSQAHCNTPIQYQKLMTHHMLAECNLTWTKALTHCFLIRDPAYIVKSYTNSRGLCTADDIGIKRQYELYRDISNITQQDIPVIDSDAVLNAPDKAIPAMCQALGVGFEASMLNWPKGKRDTDGIWASHWYKSVEASTNFAKPSKKPLTLNRQQMKVVDEVMPYYLKLKAQALAVL